MKVNHLNTAAALLLAGFAMNSFAMTETNTGEFDVNATVGSSCTVAGTLMDFGTYDPANVSQPFVDTTSTVTVTCSGTSSYSVDLNAGVNGTDYSDMNMLAPDLTGFIVYAIYKDSGYTQQWGDATGGTFNNAGTVTNGFTAYGRAAGNQTANVGSSTGVFTDTITATVTY